MDPSSNFASTDFFSGDMASLLNVGADVTPTAGNVYNSTGPLDVAAPLDMSTFMQPYVPPDPAQGTLDLRGAWGSNSLSTAVHDYTSGVSTPTNPTPQPSAGAWYSPMTDFFSGLTNPFVSSNPATGSGDKNAVSSINPGLRQMFDMFGFGKTYPAQPARQLNPAQSKAGRYNPNSSNMGLLYFLPGLESSRQSQSPQAHLPLMAIVVGLAAAALIIFLMRRST